MHAFCSLLFAASFCRAACFCRAVGCIARVPPLSLLLPPASLLRLQILSPALCSRGCALSPLLRATRLLMLLRHCLLLLLLRLALHVVRLLLLRLPLRLLPPLLLSSSMMLLRRALLWCLLLVQLHRRLACIQRIAAAVLLGL